MRKTKIIDCACVIHGTRYDWAYVDKLYAMLDRQISRDIRLHVFTEPGRFVPDHMIKHDLKEWPLISGTKKSWWYKMQMFDPEHGLGQTLYLDLDVIIVDNLDWITKLDSDYFWTMRDFKYLWRPNWKGINSSVMYWDNRKFSHLWSSFQNRQLQQVMQEFHGDQDFLTAHLDSSRTKFIDDNLFRSWRWQVWEGGMDMRTRRYRRPGAGPILDPGAKFVIFHGTPKPHEINEQFIDLHWR